MKRSSSTALKKAEAAALDLVAKRRYARFLATLAESNKNADTTQARLYWADGQVSHYRDQRLAYAIYIGMPKETRIAFRGAGDKLEVFPWNLVRGF